MENNYQGDLAEIFHRGGSMDGGFTAPNWQFPTNFSSDTAEDFGHPFTHIGDPLHHNITGTGLFNPNHKASIEDTGNCLGFGTTTAGNNIINQLAADHIVVEDGQIKRSSNSFSRMLQISPNAKLQMLPCDSDQAIRSLKGPDHHMLVSTNNHTLISPNTSKVCLLESPAALQISSPRNTGIKRRKSQAKKVVCIPAPSPANGRTTGEVVPSDLWAWRKYGQKPIKGSPHPRGYYRCSSSKGCSARKQVERSRNDPNMLVITYTSEHNHPWPTQRNALAGSSRSQLSKNNTASKNSPNSPPKRSSNPKEEQKTITMENSAPNHDPSSAAVKEEMNQIEMDDPGFDELGFPKSYKPTLQNSNNSSEDSFFADLGEIEGDPLDLLFSQGFSGDHGGRESKGLDPFSFYDMIG
ncbi:hypothetical protein BUALT_Bualt18G0131800 [Buddleja alternifolia]|uniref:WRKY domain-containing protein n=1 Tax=Buddleja alternifolia TaxID=168488 RepID=A0AAV6W3B3_9LAMI|nr:hypothetical protein BUALT_Bualt18G0131800 [Buddleja alternifolia]